MNSFGIFFDAYGGHHISIMFYLIQFGISLKTIIAFENFPRKNMIQMTFLVKKYHIRLDRDLYGGQEFFKSNFFAFLPLCLRRCSYNLSSASVFEFINLLGELLKGTYSIISLFHKRGVTVNNTGDQKNDMLCDVCFLTNFGSLIPNLIFIF